VLVHEGSVVAGVAIGAGDLRGRDDQRGVAGLAGERLPGEIAGVQRQ
jgi:hypothetical protein